MHVKSNFSLNSNIHIYHLFINCLISDTLARQSTNEWYVTVCATYPTRSVQEQAEEKRNQLTQAHLENRR